MRSRRERRERRRRRGRRILIGIGSVLLSIDYLHFVNGQSALGNHIHNNGLNISHFPALILILWLSWPSYCSYFAIKYKTNKY